MKILFLCTGNSCRSQMAEGLATSWLAKASGPKGWPPGGWEFKSAGTMPSGVHPRTIESMREIGIDISSHTSKQVDEKMLAWADHIITLCDSAKGCVYIPPPKKTTHWSIPDPVGATGDETHILKSFAKTRNIIQGHLDEFFKQHKK
ncbi:MAG: arsenate reductase ArsC [Deltaproteobacteria bacterium]|nr:arsenate reductase ArsC [Deltaproteobacteria bacterium]